MSDTKKPTLSEIRAQYEGMIARDNNAFYLLDLVERMGKALDGLPCPVCNRFSIPPKADCAFCREARALLEEIKQ